VGLEVGIRVLIPQFDPSGSLEFHYSEDQVPLGPPDTTARQYKNTGDFDVEVAFNGLGLRDRKDLREASARDFFVVGDSYSMGWGVEEEERYSNILDLEVPERVFNLSIPTDFIGYERLVGYALGQGAPVNRLIVGVCMENDLLDYEAMGDVPDRGAELSGVRWLKALLTSGSAIYLAATTHIHQNPGLREWAVERGLIVDNIAGMRRNRFSEVVIAASVARLAKLVAPYDASIIVIPSRGVWVGGNEPVEIEIHEAFVEGLSKAGLDVLDLRPLFEADGEPMAYHFANDGHWNATGHALAGNALARHLGEQRAKRSHR
jgi:hypothetical protein